MFCPAPDSHSVAIVLGCGDIGSAVALALHSSGMSVVLVDEADPAWHRRGMAFTDAWYLGNAELDGEGACFCASLKSIPSVFARRMIAATTWSWPSVAGAVQPTVLVDTRDRHRRGIESLLGRLPVTIGIGRDFASGINVDVAMDRPPSTLDEGRASGCIVEAMRHGRFMSGRRIGDSVRAGQIVGGLGNEVVIAPAAGVLVGLSARGARVEPGDPLVQVDGGRTARECFGIGGVARRVGDRVVSLLARSDEHEDGPALFAAVGGAQIV